MHLKNLKSISRNLYQANRNKPNTHTYHFSMLFEMVLMELLQVLKHLVCGKPKKNIKIERYMKSE